MANNKNYWFGAATASFTTYLGVAFALIFGCSRRSPSCGIRDELAFAAYADAFVLVAPILLCLSERAATRLDGSAPHCDRKMAVGYSTGFIATNVALMAPSAIAYWATLGNADNVRITNTLAFIFGGITSFGFLAYLFKIATNPPAEDRASYDNLISP